MKYIGVLIFFSMKVPTKEERQACWDARDAYFECLDKNQLWLSGLKPAPEEIPELDPTQPPIQPHNWSNGSLYTCKQLSKLFNSKCLPSWVWHFEITRVKALQKEFQLEKLAAQKQESQKDDFWEKVKKQ